MAKSLSNPTTGSGQEKVVLFDIDRTLFDTELFKESKLTKHTLYGEVLEVLYRLAKIANLGIFSEGKTDLQIGKLVATDIHKHFAQKHIHIVESKSTTVYEVLKKYKHVKLYLVDDKLPVLYEAKNILPAVFTIWVRRGRYAERQKPIKGFTPDAIVLNLRSIERIIKAS